MLVIDLGSNYIKYGISGTKKPHNIIISKVYKINDQYTLTKDTSSKIKYIEPIKNGVIVNFSRMDIIWKKIFQDLETIDNVKNNDILISEPLYVTMEYKNKLINHLKNTYNIKNVYFCNQQYLGMLGYCCTYGIVIDIGYTSTRIVPVCDNYIILEAIIILSLSKNQFDTYLKNNKSNLHINEYFLNPFIINVDQISITQALYNCINKCPIDLKKKLCSNIIIIGGGANHELGHELKKDFDNKYSNFTLNINVPNNKNMIIWLGCSIMATLLTNNSFIS
ncbi:actin-related protein [Hokovirus HKV1]|uniref:Actin-related protein n=1 Tax=Hokovirus HKV1 TaxID=1977638 RepID=A0A1V0SF23_9VIRU|nr:actin-related protein [Hokovirus HKV1]